MSPFTDSLNASGRGDVLAPTASSLRKRALDGAARAASAAPGVADPVQPVAAQLGVVLAQPNRVDGDVVGHANIMIGGLVARQCLACGILAECDPSRPCATCGASSFHLIPLAPKL